MDRRTLDILAAAIRELEEGSDLESCLRRHPADAGAIRKHLELRASIEATPGLEPDQAAVARGRQAMLSALGLREKGRRIVPRLLLAATVKVAAVALGALLLTGVAAAASGALGGPSLTGNVLSSVGIARTTVTQTTNAATSLPTAGSQPGVASAAGGANHGSNGSATGSSHGDDGGNSVAAVGTHFTSDSAGGGHGQTPRAGSGVDDATEPAEPARTRRPTGGPGASANHGDDNGDENHGPTPTPTPTPTPGPQITASPLAEPQGEGHEGDHNDNASASPAPEATETPEPTETPQPSPSPSKDDNGGDNSGDIGHHNK